MTENLVNKAYKEDTKSFALIVEDLKGMSFEDVMKFFDTCPDFNTFHHCKDLFDFDYGVFSGTINREGDTFRVSNDVDVYDEDGNDIGYYPIDGSAEIPFENKLVEAYNVGCDIVDYLMERESHIGTNILDEYPNTDIEENVIKLIKEDGTVYATLTIDILES